MKNVISDSGIAQTEETQVLSSQKSDLFSASSGELKRTLGVTDAVFLILSSVIGVGIFLTPKEIAVQVDNPYWFLLLWLVGGLIAMSGAMSAAALGTMMPRAGGDYAFLSAAFGRSWGFLYGYLCFVISFTGSIAALATGVVHYQGHTIFGRVLDTTLLALPGIGYQLQVEQVAAAFLVLLFTLVNHRGTRKSLNLQKIITALPIFFLTAAGLVIVYNVLFQPEENGSILLANFTMSSPIEVPSLGAISMAMIPIFFTYSGWNAALYLGEDIKAPHRIIPRALILGISIIAVIYFLFCTVIVSTIPYKVMHDSTVSIDIASHAWGFLFGPDARLVMAVIIAVLILGSLNSNIITASRIYFAMARDGLFFSGARRIHPRHGTPGFSLWAQALWACFIILFLREFETILEYTTIVITFMSIMTIAALFVLRRKYLNAHGGLNSRGEKQRSLGYPYMPIFYIISTTLILIGFLSSGRENLVKGIVGVGIIAVGFIIYHLWHRSNNYLNNRRKSRG